MRPSNLGGRERVLLVDMSERERHELRQQLLAAGFEVMIALNHIDACMKLLTWGPDGIIADADLASTHVSELANITRASAQTPASLLFLCTSPPLQDTSGTLLLKPVAFPALLSALRTSLANRDDVQVVGGWTTATD